MVRLSDVAFGDEVQVLGSRFSAPETLRLSELGIRPGAQVRVLHSAGLGGRLVAIGETRLAIDARTARYVEVAGPPTT